MVHTPPRPSQNSRQEWLSAIFTLLVLTGIYSSMDSFAGFGGSVADTPPPEPQKSISVAPPYWNSDLRYGFRSLSGDTYTASGSDIHDIVIISPGSPAYLSHPDLRVSYYKDTSIEDIDKMLDPKSPRAYSRLSHGIAVIQGDIDSPSAKTIFSTLHSD